jgi:TonB family protein
VLKYAFDAFEETIIQERTSAKLTRGVIFFISLVVHAVVLYLIFNARWSYKVFDLGEKRTDAIITPIPKLKFGPAAKAAGPEGPPGQPGESRVGEAGPARPAAKRPGAKPGEEEEKIAGEGIAGGAREAGPGGAPGSGGSPFARGFTLVYPADAMINLSKYAETPEEEILRSFRPAKTGVNFSKYVYPQSGTRGAVSGPGGPGGRFEPVGPGGAGAAVTAAVPDNVRTYDLSGWADEVLRRVQLHWTLGKEDKADWAGQVGISIHMVKSGDLTMIEITTPSKIDVLDNAARRAIEQAAPFPALPPDFPLPSLEVYFLFRYGR